MIPRILNLHLRAVAETEPCEPEVKYFPCGDNFIAFDTNTLVAVEISKAQHAELTRPREAPASTPSTTSTKSTDDRSAHRLLFSGVRPKFTLSPDVSCRQLTLHLSDQCNQRCKYCWIAPSTMSTPSSTASTPPVMPREIAAAALSMFPADGRDLRVGFFGGEPLLHFGTIVLATGMALRQAEQSKARAFFHVTTNATLITPLVAQFLAEHGFSIIVSCDGPEKLHDAARGKGSHAAMMRGLAMLHRAGCSGRIVLRGTWSALTAEPDAAAGILVRLGELNKMCAAGLAAGVALEPVAGALYGSVLNAEIHSACNWFGIHARSGGTPRWQYLEKTLQRILWQQFRPSECGAGRGYYSIGPVGQVYACHRHQNAEIGNVLSTPSTPSAQRSARDSSTVVHIDEPQRAKWLDNRFCARRECSLCWARHVCGGACRSESLEFCGSIRDAHAGRCLLMRQIVRESLHLAATLPRETLLRICPAPATDQPGKRKA